MGINTSCMGGDPVHMGIFLRGGYSNLSADNKFMLLEFEFYFRIKEVFLKIKSSEAHLLSSQNGWAVPAGQLQEIELPTSVHAPPLRQGLGMHKSASKTETEAFHWPNMLIISLSQDHNSVCK